MTRRECSSFLRTSYSRPVESQVVIANEIGVELIADSSVNASARRYVRPLPFHAGPTLQITVYVRRSASITFITPQSEKVFRDRWRQCWLRFNLSVNVPEIMPLSSVPLDINNN